MSLSLKKIGLILSIGASLAVIVTSCGFGSFGDKLGDLKDKLTDVTGNFDKVTDTESSIPGVDEGVPEFNLYVNYDNGEARLSWETVEGADRYQVYKNGKATNVTVYTTADVEFGDTVCVLAFDKGGTPIAFTGDKTLVKSNVPEISGTFSSFTITNNVAAITHYTVTSGTGILTSGTVNAGQSVVLSGTSFENVSSLTVTAYNESSTSIRSDTVSMTFSAGSSGGSGDSNACIHSYEYYSNGNGTHEGLCLYCETASPVESCTYEYSALSNGSHDGICVYCDAASPVEPCTDINGDHICDLCGGDDIN